MPLASCEKEEYLEKVALGKWMRQDLLARGKDPFPQCPFFPSKLFRKGFDSCRRCQWQKQFLCARGGVMCMVKDTRLQSRADLCRHLIPVTPQT